MTLTEFLLARIAEDETRADCYPDPPIAREIREARAKREIVDRFSGVYPHPMEGCGCYETPDGHWANVEAAATLADLAAVYADHPDYRDEWRP